MSLPTPIYVETSPHKAEAQPVGSSGRLDTPTRPQRRRGYPATAEVERHPEWTVRANRGLHADIHSVSRPLGITDRDAHVQFWQFCWINIGLIPQSMSAEELALCWDAWRIAVESI